MWPVIQMGPAAIQTGPLAWVLGWWLGIEVAKRECRRRGLASDDAWNLVLLATAVTIVSGRLVYAARYASAYAGDPWQMLALTPGTIDYGMGALFGLIAAAAYIQHRRIPLARFLDALAPGALVAVAMVALGQFLSGDAYGTPANLPWANYLWGEWCHPVQLYEALVVFLGFVTLQRLGSHFHEGSSALGALAWVSAARVLVDAFRADAATLGGGYRLMQLVALVVLLMAVWLIARIETREAG